MNGMSTERWSQVRALLEDVSAASAEDRAVLLAGAADADPSLSEAVLTLLELEPQASSLFPVDHWTAPPVAPETSRAGQQIGGFRILRELGRGGMGTVYLAERTGADFEQTVALKLLRESVATPAMAARFRQERQILARLQHPGIARLLDGGITPDGTPYAVLEYVEGQPIDSFCEARHLDLRRRLELFLEVASAVQYAHQQLVLHLDLKPANILVTDAGEPRLLDFGIARILAEGHDGRVQMTTHLLTPNYASPEQVAGEPVGVASDVFSLGTLLFRLLTGRFPYPLESSSPLEAARLIRDADPLPPSKAAPPELRSALRGDLDAILLKALRKEPAQRYETVGALAADVSRFLHSKPVRAHAGNWSYRAGKFLRRHGQAVALTSVAVAALAASTAWSLHSAAVARRERLLADQRFNEVRSLAHSFVFDLDPQLRGIPGTVAVRAYILKTGLKYLEAVERAHPTDPDLQQELASGYVRASMLQSSVMTPSLSDPRGAEDSVRKALALGEKAFQNDPHDLTRIENFVYVLQKAAFVPLARGDIDQYASMQQRAWNIGQPLLTAHPDHPDGLFEMGDVAYALATVQVGNGALWNRADPAAGLPWIHRSLDLYAEFERRFPNDRRIDRAREGSLYDLLTELDADLQLDRPVAVREAVMRRAMATVNEHQFRDDIAMTRARRLVANSYVIHLLAAHDLKRANEYLPLTVPTEFREIGDNSRLELDSAAVLGIRSLVDLESGRVPQGRHEAQRSITFLEAQHAARPDDINVTIQLLYYASHLAGERALPLATREALFRTVLSLAEPYAATHPDLLSAQVWAGRAHLGLAALAFDRRDTPTFHTELAAARQALGRVVAAHPTNTSAARLDAAAAALGEGRREALQDTTFP